MQEIIIRPATSRDCGALARIGRATFTDTFGHLYAAEDLETFLTHAYGEAYLAGLLDDPACGLWLAEKDGAPVGHGPAGPRTPAGRARPKTRAGPGLPPPTAADAGSNTRL